MTQPRRLRFWLAALVGRRRVVALGHSLGGMLLPRVATSDSALAGLIVMAGVAGDLPAAMVRQTAYLAAADDAVSPDEQRHIDAAKQFVSTVAGLTSADAGRPGLMQGAPASYWLDLRGFDAPSTARQLQQPMLVLQGERDYQVTMGDDFSLWKAALTARNAVTFHTYPALNHFFLSGQGPSLPDGYAVPGHVPGEVIEDIVDWIRALHVV